MLKHMKLYTLNSWSLLYVSYASIKRFYWDGEDGVWKQCNLPYATGWNSESDSWLSFSSVWGLHLPFGWGRE